MTKRNKQRGKARPKTSTNTRSDGGMQPQLDRFNTRTYTFQQTLGETTVAQVAGGNTFHSGATLSLLAPYHSLLDQSSTWLALFDQYRIKRVDWRFRPQFEGINFSTTDNVPVIYTVVDYDDSVNLTTLPQIREYQNCQTHMNESFNVSCVPHCAMALYAGAFSSYGNITAPWIDSASNGVPHYGLKLAITGGIGGQTNLQRWWVTCTLTVEMRNVH